MIQALSPGLLAQAKDIYERLSASIEKKYPGQYIAIDPISKEYFINPRLADAIRAARDKFPERQFYTAKIGVPSVITFS